MHSLWPICRCIEKVSKLFTRFFFLCPDVRMHITRQKPRRRKMAKRKLKKAKVIQRNLIHYSLVRGFFSLSFSFPQFLFSTGCAKSNTEKSKVVLKCAKDEEGGISREKWTHRMWFDFYFFLPLALFLRLHVHWYNKIHGMVKGMATKLGAYWTKGTKRTASKKKDIEWVNNKWVCRVKSETMHCVCTWSEIRESKKCCYIIDCCAIKELFLI